MGWYIKLAYACVWATISIVREFFLQLFFQSKIDNIEDYNDSDELRRDLMFETEDELESDLANQIGSIDADGSNCNMPWECNRPCPIGYFR